MSVECSGMLDRFNLNVREKAPRFFEFKLNRHLRRPPVSLCGWAAWSASGQVSRSISRPNICSPNAICITSNCAVWQTCWKAISQLSPLNWEEDLLIRITAVTAQLYGLSCAVCTLCRTWDIKQYIARSPSCVLHHFLLSSVAEIAY